MQSERGVSCFVLQIKNVSVDHIKEDEMGGACGMYGGEEKCMRVLMGKPEGRGPQLQNLDIHERYY